MSKYAGLDKLELVGVTFIENYNGGKIYKDDDGSFIAVKRKYVLDEQLNEIKYARDVIDHFNED